MSIREMQLMEKSCAAEVLDLNKWYELYFPNTDNSDIRMIRIKKVGYYTEMTNDSIMNTLLSYYKQIEQDFSISPNETCHKGCNDCCTNDFEISITEYFIILNYLGIKYGKEFIKKVSERAKISLNAEKCLFVDTTNGACSIYEVRPLVCRKYGLYQSICNCPKLREDELLDVKRDTSLNTIVFNHSKTNKKIIPTQKRLVQWFANMRDGDFSSEKMRALFYASSNNSADTFFEIMLT